MRRMNRSILGILLAICLLAAPVSLAADNGTDDSWSLVEWVQQVLENLFGGNAPEDDGNGDGLPNAGPHPDPAG